MNSWPQKRVIVGKHSDAQHAGAVHVFERAPPGRSSPGRISLYGRGSGLNSSFDLPATALSPELGKRLPS